MNNPIHKKNFSLHRNLIAIVGMGVITLSVLATGCSDKKARTGEKSSSPEAVAERIKPIGKVNVVSVAKEEPPETEDTPPADSEEEAQEESAGEAQTTDTEETASPAEDSATPPLTHGKAIVESSCAPCHNGNLPEAPAIGNSADWATRLPQGEETLVQHVLNGYKAMPPKGGNPSLSNEDIAAAVTYIISQVKQ